jgi:hypothetical protein
MRGIAFVSSRLNVKLFLLEATVELRWHILGSFPDRGTPALVLQVTSTFSKCTTSKTASSRIEEVAGLVLSSAAVTHWPFGITLHVLLAAWYAGKRGTTGGGGWIYGLPGFRCHGDESSRRRLMHLRSCDTEDERGPEADVRGPGYPRILIEWQAKVFWYPAS